MEKVNFKIVGCPLSQGQYERMLRDGIQEHGPGMSEGGYLRMTLIYFHHQRKKKGILHILSEILEAQSDEGADAG